jgi:hypothetical protein
MTMRRRHAVVIALALAPLAAAALAANPTQPVMIGRAGDDLDACLSTGEVTGLNPDGDNFLAVRAAPRASAPMLARLGPRHPVWICDEAAGGWIGILYQPNPGGELDCGVGSPVPRVQPYRGPCRSGWVASRYIAVVAG